MHYIFEETNNLYKTIIEEYPNIDKVWLFTTINNTVNKIDNICYSKYSEIRRESENRIVKTYLEECNKED